jgi:hypothetical protein
VPAGAVIVWGKDEGETKVQALGVVKDKDGKDKAAILLTLSFIVGPAPPEPVPPGPKPPGPNPPGPVTSFRVIMVRETGAKPGTSQQSAIYGAKDVVQYLRAKTTPEASVPGYREYDPNTNAANDQSEMQKIWAAAQEEAAKVAPCIVLQVNGKITIEPSQKNVADTVKLLKQYGGQ